MSFSFLSLNSTSNSISNSNYVSWGGLGVVLGWSWGGLGGVVWWSWGGFGGVLGWFWGASHDITSHHITFLFL